MHTCGLKSGAGPKDKPRGENRKEKRGERRREKRRVSERGVLESELIQEVINIALNQVHERAQQTIDLVQHLIDATHRHKDMTTDT